MAVSIQELDPLIRSIAGRSITPENPCPPLDLPGELKSHSLAEMLAELTLQHFMNDHARYADRLRDTYPLAQEFLKDLKRRAAPFLARGVNLSRIAAGEGMAVIASLDSERGFIDTEAVLLTVLPEGISLSTDPHHKLPMIPSRKLFIEQDYGDGGALSIGTITFLPKNQAKPPFPFQTINSLKVTYSADGASARVTQSPNWVSSIGRQSHQLQLDIPLALR